MEGAGSRRTLFISLATTLDACGAGMLNEDSTKIDALPFSFPCSMLPFSFWLSLTAGVPDRLSADSDPDCLSADSDAFLL